MKLYKDRDLSIILLFAATLLPFLILSFFNHPCNDDFWETNIVQQKGLLQALSFYYYHWSGRYFCLFLISNNPLVFHCYWAYKLEAIILLALFFFSFYCLLASLSLSNFNKKKMLALSSLLTFTYLVRMPDVGEGIFWQSGACCIGIGSVFTLFLFSCILRYSQTGKPVYYLLALLLLFATIGCYEIHMIYIDLIMVIVLLFAFKYKMPKGPIFGLVAAAILFSLLLVTAPGNAVREMDYPNKHHLLFSLSQSIKNGAIYLSHWAIIMLFLGFIIYDIFWDKISEAIRTTSVFSMHPVLALFICLSVPTLGFFPGYWAEGELLPLRAIDVVYFFTLMSFFYFLGCCICRYYNKPIRFNMPLLGKLFLYAFFAFMILGRSNNVSVAYADVFSGCAKNYSVKMEERNNYLETTSSDNCTITAITNIPHSFCFVEIPNDTTDWRYKAFCIYYHKKSILIK